MMGGQQINSFGGNYVTFMKRHNSGKMTGQLSFRFSGLVIFTWCLLQGIHVSSGDGGGKPVSSASQQPPSSPKRSVSLDENGFSNGNGDLSSQPNYNDICNNQPWCSSLDEGEKLALEAIGALHRQLDDDKNGKIDLAESNEFLREELKYEKNIENRQKAFHRDDDNDNQVSVRELWETWVNSEVHNWTVEQTSEWIGDFVGLPKYQEHVLLRGINGSALPILAVNHHNFLSSVLGVKDLITRHRITVKAMDVVLFGPPKDNSNRVKDYVLSTMLAIAIVTCFFVFKRYRSSQEDLNNMAKQMAELAKVEAALLELQRQSESEKSKDNELDEEAVVQRSNINGDDPDELIKLREENIVLRNELHRAEVELQDKCWVPPPLLQHWLQYTYELELKTYNKKKNGAERQLRQAKDACDKLKKKRSSLMGAFVSTHGRSIDDVDKAILEARTSLTEITHELQERMHRWKAIEQLVGCPIMNNPGLSKLDGLLKVYGQSMQFGGPPSIISNSQDDIDDDASSIYCPSAVHKLISTSTFLMFPGHQNPSQYPASTRLFNYHQSASDYSSMNNTSSFGATSSSGSGNSRPSQSENSAREKVTGTGHCSIPQSHSCQNSPEMATFSDNPVSGPVSSTSMARSKSVTSMISLRDRALMSMSRDASSKDSSTGEDEITGDASDIANSRDRRVTFRGDRGDRRPKGSTIGNGSSKKIRSQCDSSETGSQQRIMIKSLSATESSKPEESKEEQPPVVENKNGDLNGKIESESEGSLTVNFLDDSSKTLTDKSKVWNTFLNLVGNGNSELRKNKKAKSQSSNNLEQKKNKPKGFKSFFNSSFRTKSNSIRRSTSEEPSASVIQPSDC